MHFPWFTSPVLNVSLHEGVRVRLSLSGRTRSRLLIVLSALMRGPVGLISLSLIDESIGSMKYGVIRTCVNCRGPFLF